jgi:folate-dependent phosphoribosylglycinamide formyltransferase PurN
VDGGKIISQAAIPVDWNEDINIIGDRIFRIACEAFLNGLLIVDKKEYGTSTKTCALYSPCLRYDNSVFTEKFWNSIKNI